MYYINTYSYLLNILIGGIKLKPTSAYGVRLYQNGSSLVMHYDKTHTHVISSIIHIGKRYYYYLIDMLV